MQVVKRTKIVKVGNSYGIRIPKVLLEQLDFGGDVELSVQGDGLLLRPIRSVREGWDAQFKLMAERGDDKLLDAEAMTLTTWDDESWEW